MGDNITVPVTSSDLIPKDILLLSLEGKGAFQCMEPKGRRKLKKIAGGFGVTFNFSASLSEPGNLTNWREMDYRALRADINPVTQSFGDVRLEAIIIHLCLLQCAVVR